MAIEWKGVVSVVKEIARRPPVEACCATSLINPRSSSWRVILVTLAGANWLTSATCILEIGPCWSIRRYTAARSSCLTEIYITNLLRHLFDVCSFGPLTTVAFTLKSLLNTVRFATIPGLISPKVLLPTPIARAG